MLLYWNRATFVFIVEQEKYINSGLCVYNLKSAYLIVICVCARSPVPYPFPFVRCGAAAADFPTDLLCFCAFDRYEVISTLFSSEYRVKHSRVCLFVRWYLWLSHIILWESVGGGKQSVPEQVALENATQLLSNLHKFVRLESNTEQKRFRFS